MDSSVKVDLMVRTMMNDPNTSVETRKLIAELLSQSDDKKKESNKWFAYLDLKYSQTEEDNISGVTKTKQLMQEGNKIPYTTVDGRLVVEHDKIYTRGSALTVGKNIDENGGKFKDDGKQLLNDYITPEELWACTSCNACVEECPIDIDPLSIIMDMRRYLVMEQSAAPQELNMMMTNIENNGAPWQYNQQDRLNWKDE